ncbi:Na+/H+ antiporter NhaA [Propioniciclava sinopodophylli]|uniref:Na+/H+ antiporter NhaA n=1 Tax=Propioniciclava sinopodophylli TaxID=1837344 RepID=UPI002491D9E4|nr:Na+/H+ antiporter NhaA [Propioniciclava sinopodophylli]
MTNRSPRRILSVGSYAEHLRVGALLRLETTGGLLLMAAAALAIVWANSPAADSYFALRDLRVGPESLHLDLSLGAWAADGLLAVFFFLVGLELKNEFVAGDLRDPRTAMVPMVAAAAGVAVPALIYMLANLGAPETLRGWAIPAATDIAFAVAVLAIVGTHLPSALRLFLLTLAVVDDLIAIVIIAVVYTAELNLAALGLFLVPAAVYTVLVQRFPRWFAENRWAPWAILLPLAFVAWALLHASGIHATIAGVLLGFATPVRRKDPASGPGKGLAMTFEHNYRPLSTGFAVPVFAFFSAGVAVGGWDGLVDAVSSPVALGIIGGLVLGKPLGIVTSTFLLTRLTRANLDPTIRWIDLAGVGLLAGIGFTVSLLVGELSFGLGSDAGDAAKVGILLASVLAALLASLVLVPRNRRYRRATEAERRDADADGIPDAFDAAPHDPTISEERAG